MTDPIPGKEYHVWHHGEYLGVGVCETIETHAPLFRIGVHSWYGDRWQPAEQKADV